MKYIHLWSQKSALCLAMTLLATGCTTPQQYARTRALAQAGIDPSINAQQAIDWSNNQTAFLEAFHGGAKLPADNRTEWTGITRNGLAFVDTQCNLFFANLDDYADEQRNLRESTGLVGTASATLLALANAATAAIAAVAGAFTLTQGLMDSGAQTILFPIPPTRLLSLHAKAADAYRAARLGDPSKNPITSRAHATEVIGGYAQLCTPVALKGLVGDTLDQVRFGARPGDGRVVVEGFNGPAANNLVTPGSTFGAEQTLRQSDFKADKPIVPAKDPTPHFRGRETPAERTLDAGQVQRIQAFLCVSEDGEIGPNTREAFRQWQIATGVLPAERNNARLNEPQVADLVVASRAAPACDTAVYRNFLESVLYREPDAVQGLADDLNEAGLRLGVAVDLASDIQSINDPRIREAIKAIAPRLGLPVSDAVTPQFDDRIR